MKVTKEQINEWGSTYNDRADSFDDTDDITILMECVLWDESLLTYIKQYIPENIKVSFRKHPDGPYGVDLGIVESNTNNRICNLDVERWSQWKDEWPSNYRCISFLARKDKFLKQDVPFFMCYFNYYRSKLLIVEEHDILNTPALDKKFASGKGIDKIRSLPFNVGHIFGIVTDKEKRQFNYADIA